MKYEVFFTQFCFANSEVQINMAAFSENTVHITCPAHSKVDPILEMHPISLWLCIQCWSNYDRFSLATWERWYQRATFESVLPTSSFFSQAVQLLS